MGVNMMPPLAIERVPSTTRPTKPATIRRSPRARARNRNMWGYRVSAAPRYEEPLRRARALFGQAHAEATTCAPGEAAIHRFPHSHRVEGASLCHVRVGVRWWAVTRRTFVTQRAPRM